MAHGCGAPKTCIEQPASLRFDAARRDISPETRHWYRGGLWLAVLAYTLLFSAISVSRHDRLVTTVFDLGIFDQSVWLISRGHSLFLTTRGLYPFQDHFTPVLYLLAPLYWVCPTPKLLLVLQSAALAGGAVPVYNIAAKRLRSEALGLLFALSYLLYPCIGWMNVFDFHPETLAVPLLLLACWFAESKRPQLFLTSLVVALLCKETIGLTVALLGFYAWPHLGRRFLVITVALGLIGLLLGIGTLRYCNHGQPSAYITLYAPYGHSIGEVAATLLHHPEKLLDGLGAQDNVQYLLNLLIPTGCLVLAAPELLLLAIPALLSNMLSNRPSMHTIHYQYNAQVAPFVIVAAIAGFDILERLVRPKLPNYIRCTRGGLALLLVCGMAFGVQQGPLLHIGEFTLAGGVEGWQMPAVQQAVAAIPSDASVCAQTAIAAHLTERRRIYMFPNPFQPACWGNTEQALRHQVGQDFVPFSPEAFRRSAAITDVQYVVLGPSTSSHFPLNEADYRSLARLMLTDPHYGAVWSGGDIVVLRRGADHHRGLQRLDRFASGVATLLGMVGLNAPR